MFPEDYYLRHSYPGAHRGLPRLEYALPADASIVLEMYDLSGNKLITLVEGKQCAGTHSYDLNASPLRLQGGTYFCRMAAYDSSLQMKYVNVKKLNIIPES